MTVASAIAEASIRTVASANARRLAQNAIIDTLACMVAGRTDQSTCSVRT
jgi:2-methylcitrate dehydratase PrpD